MLIHLLPERSGEFDDTRVNWVGGYQIGRGCWYTCTKVGRLSIARETSEAPGLTAQCLRSSIFNCLVLFALFTPRKP